MAGASPNSTPVTVAASAATASTRRSTATDATRGTPSGIDAFRIAAPHFASTTPPAVPIAESIRLSIRRPRASCQRVPPSAARTASSRSREVARASIRFATFTHAISSTSATAASNSIIQDRTAPTIASRSGTTPIEPASLNQAGYCAASPSVIRWMRACAMATVTPGLSRPTTVHVKLRPAPARERSAGAGPNGTHTSTAALPTPIG